MPAQVSPIVRAHTLAILGKHALPEPGDSDIVIPDDQAGDASGLPFSTT